MVKKSLSLMGIEFQKAEFDSRKIEKGDLFFALKGEKTDGHIFLRDVAEKGAVAAVVSKDYVGESFGLPLIRVEDVGGFLQNFAKKIFSIKSSRVVAVTGSAGKTTTKEFIATLLEAKYRVAKTPGNANSQVSVPLSILNLHDEEEVFVVEMGMSAPHEIERLVDIAPPEVAVITKIALAHAEFFPTGEEGIAHAKAEIFSHPKTRLGIYPKEAERFAPIVKRGSSEKRTFAINGSADYTLALTQSEYKVHSPQGTSPAFSLPFTASHLCEDALAAIAVALDMGLSWEEIIAQLPKLATYKRRFEKIEKEGITYINDSYNANPASTRAALSNLPEPLPGGKRLAVLGEMRELGAFSEQSHKEIGEHAQECVDHLLCYGRLCQSMANAFSTTERKAELFVDFEELQKRLKAVAEKGDVVLIKGSKSLEMWRLLED